MKTTGNVKVEKRKKYKKDDFEAMYLLLIINGLGQRFKENAKLHICLFIIKIHY